MPGAILPVKPPETDQDLFLAANMILAYTRINAKILPPDLETNKKYDRDPGAEENS
jgi:hypothetical protein